MAVFDEKQHRCRLCGNNYSDSDMSEEHYPVIIITLGSHRSHA